MNAMVLLWGAPPGSGLPNQVAAIVGPPGPRVGERVQTVISAASITPDVEAYDVLDITGLATAASIANPSGDVPSGAPRLMIRMLDDGVNRALSWGDAYASAGPTLPNETTAGKLMHLGFIYHAASQKWQLLAASVAP